MRRYRRSPFVTWNDCTPTGKPTHDSQPHQHIDRTGAGLLRGAEPDLDRTALLPAARVRRRHAGDGAVGPAQRCAPVVQQRQHRARDPARRAGAAAAGDAPLPDLLDRVLGGLRGAGDRVLGRAVSAQAGGRLSTDLNTVPDPRRRHSKFPENSNMNKRSLLSCVTIAVATFAASAQAADPAAGKRQYDATCIACHGPGGIAVAPIYPNLGGQKEEYLVDRKSVV